MFRCYTQPEERTVGDLRTVFSVTALFFVWVKKRNVKRLC